MLFLKHFIVFFAAIFCVVSGFETQQKILDQWNEVLVRGRTFGAEQAVFERPGSASATVQVFWKDEKSAPPSSHKYNSPDNETLLDV